ncbi:MAG TPA: alpha-L-arabinofuranosidase C-terminal domain-containing protein, partial [Cellulomonas sp.]
IWCLGNEMDGPWQLGHRSAEDYGKLAAQTARAMKAFDPDLELVVCGSSGSSMPTFLDWERTVLAETYDAVDYISCHAYYEDRGDLASFLASGVDMDRFIRQVTAVADEVKAERGSDKTIDISFDEWNIWYNTRFETVEKITGVDNWPVAPRLLEDVYSVADAVVLGSLLITLLRHADRVASASLAQLVNVIAPIMTEPGGAAWRQTTFFPFAETSHHARGVSLDVGLVCETYATEQYGDVEVVTSVATYDAACGEVSVYAVNRSVDAPVTLEIDVSALPADLAAVAVSLHDDHLTAANTAQQPDRVGLRANTTVSHGGGVVRVELPPVSWTQILLRPAGDPVAM